MPTVAGTTLKNALKNAPKAGLLTACVLASTLLATGWLVSGAARAQDHAFAWNPRSGDAWIDRQLADINVYGGRYRGAFIDELVRYHAAPRGLVEELVDKRNWAPGDVYYACAVAQVIGRPCRAIVDAWGQSHAEGWEEVASQVGIAKRPGATARLKRDITESYVRWGRPLATVEKAKASKKASAMGGRATGTRSKKPAKPGP